jgi:hypothetical protein
MERMIALFNPILDRIGGWLFGGSRLHSRSNWTIPAIDI